MALLARRRRRTAPAPEPASAPASPLPPSVARVAERMRLSAELLAATLELERRSRVSLDDIERADALAERLLARRRRRAVDPLGAGGRRSA